MAEILKKLADNFKKIARDLDPSSKDLICMWYTCYKLNDRFRFILINN
jgi:hypothetical protein